MSAHETIAYKVLTVEQWTRLQEVGLFSGSPDDIADGYIHLSTRDQLRGTLDKYYKDMMGVILAEVRLTGLGDTLRWEESRGNALFPHIYGGLPLAAVTNHWSLVRDRDGNQQLPAELG